MNAGDVYDVIVTDDMYTGVGSFQHLFTPSYSEPLQYPPTSYNHSLKYM